MLAVGFGLRAHVAAHPNRHLSSDEYSYVTIASALAEGGTYGGRADFPLRWPPGTPMTFAVAQKLDGAGVRHGRSPDIPSAYWAQAVVGTATIGVVALLVGLLAGAAPALLAAGLTAVYPPLVTATGDLLSEPLGALVLSAALLAVVWATRRPRLHRFVVAGLAIALAVLTRADYLLLAPVLAAVVGASLWRRCGARGALGHAGALLAAVAVGLLPWTIYVSGRANHLTPVTTGDAPAFFVGTFLPGDGTTIGMKRVLGAEARAATQYRSLKDVPSTKLPASVVLDAVAARHPGVDRTEALRHEAVANLRYDVRHPVRWAGMVARKVKRMWWQPSRIGSAARPGWVAVVHVGLLAVALVGIGLGLRRRPRWPLALLAVVPLYATAVHALTVAQPRYNLVLIPLLIAGGVVGLWPARPAPDYVKTPDGGLLGSGP